MKLQIPKLPKRPSLPPGVVKLLVIVCVGALAINCVTMFSEFPLNGNPFQWLKAQEFYKAARTSVKKCDFLTAQRQLKEAVQVYDRSARFQVALGDCDLRLRQYEDAKNAFEQAVKLNPTDVSAWKKLSRSWALLGDREHSVSAVRKALDLAPSDPGANAQYGLLLQVGGQEKEAAKVFDQSRSLDRDTAEYWWLAGQYYKLLGKQQESEAGFRQAASKEPSEPEYAEWLGLCLRSLGKTTEAEKYLRQACELNRTDAEYWAALAETQSAEGYGQSALESLKRAIDLDPGRTDWKKTYAFSLAQTGRYADAEKYFDEALKQNFDVRAFTYYLQALTVQGKFQKAESILQQRLKTDGENVDVNDLICLGDVYAAEGQTDKALQTYKKALAIKELSPQLKEDLNVRIASPAPALSSQKEAPAQSPSQTASENSAH